VSSGGTPGTWTKYFNGDWTQPGLGGNATGIPYLLGATVYQMKTINQASNLVSVGSGNGITASFGNDPLNWRPLYDPLLYADGLQWSRTNTSTELISYPSFVTFDGSTGPIGDDFWVFYMYLEPGANYGSRYLVRRAVSMTFLQANQNTTTPQGGVELSRYVSSPASWTTTALPISGGFTYDKSMGYILTASYPSSSLLYECYISGWSDHVLTLNRGDCNSSGMIFLRTLGWIFTSAQPNTTPIYRCFNSNTNKHSVSFDSACEGNGSQEFVIGWTMNN